jgi:acyl-CoA reductase-like NAD-dependent aldehyde dehydrogenase
MCDCVHAGEWSQMSGKQRGDLLYRLAELIDQEKESLALLGTPTATNALICCQPFHSRMP